jgi:hypothetical protein
MNGELIFLQVDRALWRPKQNSARPSRAVAGGFSRSQLAAKITMVIEAKKKLNDLEAHAIR